MAPRSFAFLVFFGAFSAFAVWWLTAPRAPLYNLDPDVWDYMPVAVRAPRLVGTALKTFANVLETPIIGPLITAHLIKDNKFFLVDELASKLPFPARYLPIHHPTADFSKDDSITAYDFVQNAEAAVKVEGDTVPWTSHRYRTIAEYYKAYISKKTTPTKVAQAFLAQAKRLDEAEPPLRAFENISAIHTYVLEQAAEATRRHAHDKPLSILDGVLVAVKSEVTVRGVPLTKGTSFLGEAQAVPTKDAPAVQRLRDAGAIIVPGASMHEIGIGTTGFNQAFGTARNPYNTKHYTGGSSAGSAAAVAAGLVPLAIGKDGGGSIRIPAGLCGVVGLKPTFERIPSAGTSCWSVAHDGPIAATVMDAAIGYAVMAGAPSFQQLEEDTLLLDVRQPPVMLPAILEQAKENEKKPLAGRTVGVFTAWTDDSLDSTRRAFRETIETMKKLGAQVTEIKIPHLSVMDRAHSLTICTETRQTLNKFMGNRTHLDPDTRIKMSLCELFTATQLHSASVMRSYIIRAMEKVFDEVDFVASPTTASSAPAIQEDALYAGESDIVQTTFLMRYASLANFAGLPAITVPVAQDAEGLPISFQLMAKPWHEAALLATAAVLEAAVPNTRLQPPPVSVDLLAK